MNRQSVPELLCVLGLCIGLSTCSSGHSDASTAPTSLLLNHSGRWITDSQGRVVVVHGMNYVKKSPTTLPDGSKTLDTAADGFGDKDLQWLQDNGFNGLRLGVEDYGVEPQPGAFDETYIAAIASMASKSVAHEIFPLIDFHEDDFSPDFASGNGLPAWMVQDDGLPHTPECGFGCDQFVMPALLVTWDHFWADQPAADGMGLQEHFARATAHVASELAGIEGLLGYEILNEPWPGSSWPSCLAVNKGCPKPDAALSRFNQIVTPALRQADARHLIFAEPYSTFNDSFPTNITALADGNAGFAFHVYCLLDGADQGSELPGAEIVCPPMETKTFDNADAHVMQTQEAQLMTEFGATPDTRVITRLTTDADQHMTSWLWWTYDEGTGLDPSKNPPDQNLDQAVANLLVRAYPRAIAGTPQNWSFDATGKTFTLTYTTQRVDGSGDFPAGSLTEIFLPQRQYPNGYRVSVTGGSVLSEAGSTLLEIASQSGATRVQVNVTPAS